MGHCPKSNAEDQKYTKHSNTAFKISICSHLDDGMKNTDCLLYNSHINTFFRDSESDICLKYGYSVLNHKLAISYMASNILFRGGKQAWNLRNLKNLLHT